MRVKKILAIFQIVLLFFGITCGMLSGFTQVAYAKTDSSSSSNSALQNTEKKLGQNNNVMNSTFSSGAQKSIVNQTAQYNEKVQLLATFAYLMDTYGNGKNYASLYSNPKNLIQQFNSVAPGVNFPEMGEENVINNLTNSSKSNTSDSTKAEKIAASAYSTSMSTPEKEKWMSQNSLGQLALKYASPLAANAVKATSVSDNRKPYARQMANSGNDTSKGSWGSLGRLISNGIKGAGSTINSVANGAKDAVTGKNGGDETYNGTWAVSYVANGSSSGLKEVSRTGNYLEAYSISKIHSSYNQDGGPSYLKDLIGESSYMKSKQDDLKNTIAIGIMDYLKNNSSNITSKSQLQSKLNGMSAQSYVGNDPSSGNTADEWHSILSDVTTTLPVYDQNYSEFATGYGFNFISYGFTGNYSWNQLESKLKSETPAILPDQVKAAGGASNLGVWGQNYSKYMNTKTSGSVSDDNWKAFESFAKNDKQNEQQANTATKGNALISWSPVYPHWNVSKGMVNTESHLSSGAITSDGFKKDSNGFVPLKNEDFFANASDNILYMKGASAPQLALGADSSAIITNNESIYNYTHAAQSQPYDSKPSAVAGDYGKSFSGSSLGGFSSNGDIDGYDSYGNIIDGQNMSIIVPYWNNLTKSGLVKNPLVRTNSYDFGLEKTLTGEANADMNDVKRLVDNSKEAYNLADKAKTALKGTGGMSLAQQLAKVSSAVGGGSSNSGAIQVKAASTSMNTATAAAEAILIVAKTGVDTTGMSKAQAAAAIAKAGGPASFNSNFINKAVKVKQLYLGNSDTKRQIQKDKEAAQQKGRGTMLYTATDIIQRIGLQTDYGDFDQIRKTIVSMIDSTYNSEIGATQVQNVFATDTFGSDGLMQRLGLMPYFAAMIFIEVILGFWTAYQYWKGEVKGTKFLTRTGKFIIVIMALASIHSIEEIILNKPSDWAIQVPLKQQSIIDQWSKLKQEKDVTNVFYSSLFQDTQQQQNHSTDYMIPFYTSTLNNGEVDTAVSDPMKNKAQATTDDTGSVTTDSVTNSAAWRAGDGKVPWFTAEKYKTVNVTLADLTNWASHMARQLYTAQNKGGFQSGQADAEKPAAGYKPGQEPLFAWLANNYQPIGTTGQGDNTDGTKGGANAEVVNKYGKNAPDSQYGNKRNPADTSIKSAYSTDKTGNQINNASLYKNFNHYSEFAVNTKHYASQAGINYGIDKDSDGGPLTASQAFLRIWLTIFANSGANGDPGDANSLNSLMNFGQALNGNMGDQTTSDNVGQDNGGTGVSIANIGQTGRNDLINEVSMTKHQREALNGNNGGFSSAAQSMIDTFQIPAGSSDYFNFDQDGSIVDTMDPYIQKYSPVRDGIIFKLNKSLLNDYVSIYAPVRAQINPSNANSSDDSGNNQTNSNSVDPYTMAEDQVMAVEAFFNINKILHYSMFPHGYEDNTISLNTWNRMLFIPVGVMNQYYTDDQYNQDNHVGASPVNARDNVVEYISLNTGIISLLMFVLMNFALIGFGFIMTIIFKFVFPAIILLSIIRNFISPSKKGTLKGLLQGSIGLMLVFGAIKFGLVELIAYLSRTMNNNFDLANGYNDLPVGSHATAVVIYLIIAFVFLTKLYFPFVSQDIWTLGGQDGHIGRNFGVFIGGKYRKNPIRRRIASRLIRAWGRERNNARDRNLRYRIGQHTNHIKSALYDARHPISTHMRKIKDRKIMSTLSDGNPYYKRGNDTLSGRVSDLENSRYGGVKSTSSGGLDLDELNSKNINNGDMIDTIDKGSASFDLGSKDTGETVQKIIDNSNLKGVHTDGQQLIFDNTNSGMFKTAGGRKELFNDLLIQASHQLDLYKGHGDGKITKAPNGLVGIDQSKNGDINIPVDQKNGVDPEKLDRLLGNNVISKNFDVVNTPIVQHGKYANGKLQLRAKPGINKELKTNELESILHGYTDRAEFDQKYNSMINVGKQLDKSKLGYINNNGMKYVNGKVFYNNKDLLQQDAAANISDEIHKKYLTKAGDLNKFVDAGSDYVVDGAGHGFTTPNFTPSTNHSYVTQRFASNNNRDLSDGLKGLSKIASDAGVTREAYIAQNQFNQALLNKLGSPGAIIGAYEDYAHRNHMRFDQPTQNIIREIQGTMDNYGPVGYNQLDKNQKNHIDHLMNKLNGSLEHDNQLNTLQNGVSASLDMPEQRKLADIRKRLIGLSGVHNPNLFNKMTVGQIGNNAAQAASMKNVGIDKNGILTGDIPKNMATKMGQQRISSLVRSLTE